MDQSLATAAYWRKEADGRIHCELCPHHCRIKEGQAGLCKVRGVRGGVLQALGYGLISSAHVDPIEKKPLYHFHPGQPIYSVGGWGCNFGCMFCQNWTISQRIEDGPRHTPDAILGEAQASGCALVAYTYNEPLVGFEFVRDCSRLARDSGLRNVLVTNGYIETTPAAELLPLIDALNVDIKSIEDAFYRKHCHGTLEPVQRFCGQAVAAGCHLEITNLIIPTLNDTPELIGRLAGWIKANLGERVPLHLSAYRPEYKSQLPPTPARMLDQAYEAAREHLVYVYVGNVHTARGQNTYCPGCGHALIERVGYQVALRGLRHGACVKCGRAADVRLA